MMEVRNAFDRLLSLDTAKERSGELRALGRPWLKHKEARRENPEHSKLGG